MSQEHPLPKNEEPEEDWLLAPIRKWEQETSNNSGIWINYKEKVPPVFVIDETPLTPPVEVKACSILNPNCDVCQ